MLILTAIAAAATPHGSVELHGAPWFGQAEQDVLPVVGLRGGLLVEGHWEPGLVVEGGPGPRLGGRADLRWLHGDVLHGRPSGFLGVTGGAWWDGNALNPAGGPELGAELPIGPAFLHIDATVLLGEDQVAMVGVGLGWRKRAPAPAPVEPAPAAPRSGTMVWIAHPWCEWIPIEEADDELAALPPGTKVRVVKPGFLPTEVDAAGAADAQMEPLPPQGALTLAGASADRVRLTGQEAQLGRTGSLSMLAGEGVVKLHVEGGGRRFDQVVAVSAGRALWVDIPDPQPLVVYFPVRSAVVDKGSLSTLKQVVADAGNWSFEVAGSASPEGNAAENEALAAARAAAVRDALVAAGMPPERVRLGPSYAPDATLAPEEQRMARITPVVSP